MRKLMFLAMGLLAVLCTACHNHIDNISYATSESEHTLLIYMMGDNSLSTYVEPNLSAIKNALKTCDTPLNVVIYRDNLTADKNLPVLFQLKRRADSEKIDTIYLKQWSSDIDSTDPEVIADIVHRTFSRFNSDIKGIELWSHGLSWIPSSNFTTDGTTRATAYIGEDNTSTDNKNGSSFGELWSLREALESADVHFNYAMFDACNMGTAEVAYELRDLCDYILAAPTEILGYGFPYNNMIASLSTVRDTASLLSGLTAAYEDFKTKYEDNGTFSLLRTAGFQRLLDACLALEDQAADRLTEMAAAPSLWQSRVQNYGRRITSEISSRYYFYDVQDWADRMCQDDLSADASQVTEALAECVIAHYNSEKFVATGSTINLSRCCGLGMSVPQFWTLSGNSNLDEAYKLIQWNLKTEVP
ncbi:MAG: hypothetical protein K6E73_06140 [Bacteroidales bacterium]|nr:hypothetical protein [Bacteroidales bacterium]